MAYRLPSFNVDCNFWRFGTPTTDPPDLTVKGNFGWGRRVTCNDAVRIAGQLFIPALYLLLPKTAIVFGAYDNANQPDTVEVAAGSGRFYTLLFWDFNALGFANEHIVCLLAQGLIIPSPGTGEVLLEDGTDVLCEDGTPVLVE